MATHRFRSRFDRLLALWVLRAFSPGLGRSDFFNGSTYADTDIAEFLGLPRRPDEKMLREMPRLLDDLQFSLEQASPISLPALAKGNFTLFAATLKLNPPEQRVLEFFACMEIEAPLADSGRLMRKIIGKDAPQFLARVLDLPRHAVAKALAPSGRLIKCGLLKNSPHPARIVRLAFHSEELAIHLLRETYDPAKLLKSFGVVTPAPPELGLADFPHLQMSLDLLLPYVSAVQAKRKAGVNVLIHGAPGTGKSQLVRVLGQVLDIPVFELDTADNEGDPLRACGRLSVLNLAQTYFHDSTVLLVFDEAEDILTPSVMHRGMANTHKGWFNQMLEKNRQPVFWISNSIESLDPAFARRFDFILDVPIPPKAQRGRILREKAGKLVSPGLIEHLAGIEHLAPAVVTRARNVIQSIRRDIPKGNRDAALTHVIGGMDGDERQTLLETIARQAAEIIILKQTIDALCRRIHPHPARARQIRSQGRPSHQAIHQPAAALPLGTLHRHPRPHRRSPRQPLRLPPALLSAGRKVRPHGSQPPSQNPLRLDAARFRLALHRLPGNPIRTLARTLPTD